MGIVTIISRVGVLLNKKNKFCFNNRTPFECGIVSTPYRTIPLRLRFFILAVIFLIFDVELILLFPVLLLLCQSFSLIRIVYFFIFLIIISWGLLWEWNQLLLNWRH